jgi:hypothetical protein
LEEVPEMIVEPPLSSLMLVIGAFFEPGELSIRDLCGSCSRMAFEELELCIIGFVFSKAVVGSCPWLAG